MADMEVKKTKCIMCEGETDQRYWVSVWKGKQGTLCDRCCSSFYAIGYYLLEKAREEVEAYGITVLQTKEKFGRMVMYSGARTEQEGKFLRELQYRYEKMYPEFVWDW